MPEHNSKTLDASQLLSKGLITLEQLQQGGIDTSKFSSQLGQGLSQRLREPTEEELKAATNVEKSVLFKQAFPQKIFGRTEFPLTEQVEPPSAGEMFSASFALGKDMIEESMWKKLDADREQGVGLGSVLPESWIKYGLEDNAADIERNIAVVQQRYEQKPLEYSEIVKDPERFFSHTLPELLGQSIPLLAIPLASSIGGGAAGFAVAGPVGIAPGILWGSILGMGAGRFTESLAEAGGVYETALREGKSKEDAFNASEDAFKMQMAVGIMDIPQIALGFLPMGAVAGQVARLGMRATAKAMSKSALKSGFWARNGMRMAAILGMEGGEEGVQFVINEVALNRIRDEDMRTDLSFKGLWDNEEFISSVKAGTIVGVMLGGGMRIISEASKKMGKQIEVMDPVKIAQMQEAAQQIQIFKHIARGKESEMTARIEIEGEKKDGLFSNMAETDVQARLKDSKKKAVQVVKEIEKSADIFYSLQSETKIKGDENFHLAYRMIKMIDFLGSSKKEKKTTTKQKFIIDAEIKELEVMLDRIYSGEDVQKIANTEFEEFNERVKTGAIFAEEVKFEDIPAKKAPTKEKKTFKAVSKKEVTKEEPIDVIVIQESLAIMKQVKLEINQLYSKFKDKEFPFQKDDVYRHKARIADKHFEDLSKEVQEYLETKAEVLDFEDPLQLSYIGLLDGTIRASHIITLEQGIQNLEIDLFERGIPEITFKTIPKEEPKVAKKPVVTEGADISTPEPGKVAKEETQKTLDKIKELKEEPAPVITQEEKKAKEVIIETERKRITEEEGLVTLGYTPTEISKLTLKQKSSITKFGIDTGKVREERKVKEARKVIALPSKKITEAVKGFKKMGDLNIEERTKVAEALEFTDVDHLLSTVNEEIQPGIFRSGLDKQIGIKDVTPAIIQKVMVGRKEAKKILLQKLRKPERAVPPRDKGVVPKEEKVPKESPEEPLEDKKDKKDIPLFHTTPAEEISEKEEGKEKEKKSKLLKWADQLDKAKWKDDGTIHSSIFPIPPASLWNGAVKVLQASLRAGDAINKAIKKFIEHLTSSDWYKALSRDDQFTFKRTASSTVKQDFKSERPITRFDEEGEEQSERMRPMDENETAEIDEDDEQSRSIERARQMIRDVDGMTNSEARQIIPKIARGIKDHFYNSEEVLDPEVIKENLEEIAKKPTQEGLLASHLIKSFSDDQLVTLIAELGSIDIYGYVSVIWIKDSKTGRIEPTLVEDNKVQTAKQLQEGLEEKVRERFEEMRKKFTSNDLDESLRNRYQGAVYKNSKGKTIDNRINVPSIGTEPVPYGPMRTKLNKDWRNILDKNSEKAKIIKGQILDMDIILAELITGVSGWEAFLNSYAPKGNYRSIFLNNERDNTGSKGFDLGNGTTNALAGFVLQSPYTDNQRRDVSFNRLENDLLKTDRSQLKTLSQALSKESPSQYIDSFRDPSFNNVDALHKDSPITNRARIIHEVSDDNKFLKDNLLVQLHKKEGKPIPVHYLSGLKISNEVNTVGKTMEFSDRLLYRFMMFLQGKRIYKGKYLHYVERLGERNSEPFVAVPLYNVGEAKRIYAKISKEGNIPSIDKLEIKDVETFINLLLKDGLLTSKTLKEGKFNTAREMARAFVMNEVVNKFYVQQYFFGKEELYYGKDGKEDYIGIRVKRASRLGSTGYNLLPNLKGGIPKNLNYVVVNDLSEDVLVGLRMFKNDEKTDGHMLYPDDVAKMLAVSMGSIASQGRLDAPQSYIPFIKTLYDKTDDNGDRIDLKQAASALHKGLEKLSPTVKALRKYLKQQKEAGNEIHFVVFKSSAKIFKGEKVMKLFDDKGAVIMDAKPIMNVMDSKYLFVQTEFRGDPKMQPKAMSRQIRRFIKRLPGHDATQEIFNSMFNIQADKVLDNMENWTEEDWKKAVRNAYPDTELYDWNRSLLDNIDGSDHPDIKKFEKSTFLSNMIGKKVLEPKFLASRYPVIPDMGYGLKSPRLMLEGKEITLAEYDKLEDKEKVFVLPGEALVPAKSGLIIGQMILINRDPSDGLHSMALVEVKEFLPEEMGNLIIVDRISSILAGEDYDADTRFVFSHFNDKEGEPIAYHSETKDPKAMANGIVDKIILGYLDPKNFYKIFDPIDNEAVNDQVKPFRDALIGDLNKYKFSSQAVAFDVTNTKKAVSSVIARTMAIMLDMSTKGVTLKQNFGFNLPMIKDKKWTGEATNLNKFVYNDHTATLSSGTTNLAMDDEKNQGTLASGLTAATAGPYMMLHFMTNKDGYNITRENLMEFFNHPSIIAFNKRYKKEKRFGTNMKDSEIFNVMAHELVDKMPEKEQPSWSRVIDAYPTSIMITKEDVNGSTAENKLKMLLYLRYLNNVSADLMVINRLINYNEKAVQTFAELYELKNLLDMIDKDGVKDASGNIMSFSKLTLSSFNMGVDYFSGARLNYKLSSRYYKTESIEGTPRSEAMLEKIESTWAKYRNDPKKKLTKPQMEMYEEAVNMLWLADAFNITEDKEEFEKRIMSKFKEEKEKNKDNFFLQNLFIGVKTKKIQLSEKRRNEITDEEFTLDMQEGFSQLEETFKWELVQYHFYNHPFSSVNKGGAFERFFDWTTHDKISEELLDVRKRWSEDNKFGNKTFGQILKNNPDLVPDGNFDIKEGATGMGEQYLELKKTQLKNYPEWVKRPVFNKALNQIGWRYFNLQKEGGRAFYRLVDKDKSFVFEWGDRGYTISDTKKGIDKPDDKKELPSAKNMLQPSEGEEALASRDPKFQEWVKKQIKIKYPRINEKLIDNWTHKGRSVIGAAIASTMFIDSSKAVQSTRFHELSHMYWDALPDNDSVKVKLIEMFDTEEQAIIAIGRAGTKIAEEEFKSLKATYPKTFNLERFMGLLKSFWRKVKALFNIRTKEDMARVMADRIWSNHDNISSEDFIGQQMKYMEREAEADPEIIKQHKKAEAFLEKVDFPVKKPGTASLDQIIGIIQTKKGDIPKDYIPIEKARLKFDGLKEDRVGLTHAILLSNDYTPRVLQLLSEDEKTLEYVYDTKTGKHITKVMGIGQYASRQDTRNRSQLGAKELDLESISVLRGLNVSEQSDMILLWTDQEMQRHVIGSKKNTKPIIQAFRKHAEVFDELVETFDKFKTHTEIQALSDEDFTKLYNETNEKEDLIAVEPFLAELNVYGLARVVKELLSGKYHKPGELNVIGLIALYELHVKKEAPSFGKLERLVKVAFDEGSAIMQLKNSVIGMTNWKATDETNRVIHMTIESMKEMKKKNLDINDVFITDSKEGLLFRDPQDESQMKIFGSKEARELDPRYKYLFTIIDTIEKYTPFYKHEDRKKNILRVPKVIPDLLTTIYKDGIGKAINMELGKKSSLDSIAIEHDDRVMKLRDARSLVITNMKNKMLGKSATAKAYAGKIAKNKIEKLEKEAEKLTKRGFDADNNIIYDVNPSVPLSGISFVGEFDDKNIELIIRRYIKALIHKSRLEPLVPFVRFFQNFYKSDGNEQMKQLLKISDDMMFFNINPESALPEGMQEALVAIMSLTRYRFIALNFKAGIFNLSAGQTQNFVDMEYKLYMRGLWRMVRHTRKSVKILKRYDVIKTFVDAEQSLSQRGLSFLQNWSFIFITFVEYINQGMMYTGMMTDKEFAAYDDNGNIINEKDALSAATGYGIQAQTQRTHGPYHSDFRIQMNYYPEGNSLMQLKTWMISSGIRQIGVEHADLTTGKLHKGMLRTLIPTGEILWKKMTRKDATWDDLSSADKRNLAKWVRAIMLIAPMMMWIVAQSDDDKDKSLIANVRRALGDILYIYDVDNISFLLSAPFPFLSTTVDYIVAIEELFQQNVYQQNSKYVKKGGLVFYSKAASVSPFSALVKSMMEIHNE